MTLFQMLLVLTWFILILLACFAIILIWRWRREDAANAERWEVGSQIYTRLNPHDFLPGAWRVAAHLTDGTKVWERIA